MKTLANRAQPRHAIPGVTLERLARIVSAQYGLGVSFDEAPARIEGDLIVLPNDWRDAGQDDRLVGRLDALIARLRYGSPGAIDALPRGLERTLAQAIDDHRCCQRLLATYPGASAFLASLRRAEREHANSAHLRHRWTTRYLQRLIATLWRDDESAAAQPVLHDGSPSTSASMASSGKRPDSVERAWQSTRPLIDLARGSASSTDSVRHALAIARVADRFRLSVAGNSAGSFERDPGHEVAEPDDDDATVRAARPRRDDEDQLRSRADEDLPAAPAQRGRAGAGSDDDDDAPPSPSTAPSDADDPSTEPIRPDASDASEQARGRLRGPSGQPLYSIALTREFDSVTDHSGQGERAAWLALHKRALAATGNLADKLERLLRADEQQHWRFERERGLINAAALSRLAVRPGYRTPFKVQAPRDSHRVAVSILVDLSASMSGEKIELARLCTAAMASALLRLGFPFEVAGFNSRPDPRMKAHFQRWLELGVDMRAYNRFVEILDLHVYKSFAATEPSGLALMQVGQQNPDGEALSWAGARLLAQAAPRRVLFVLSDGHPVTGDGNKRRLQTDLKQRIAELRKADVELVGIGIGDDAAGAYYDDPVIVRDLAALPKLAFNRLSATLLRRD